MPTHRRTLPTRRFSETFNLQWLNRTHSVSVSYYQPNHQPAEVFITISAMLGSELDAIARDGAILISLALQHGVPLSTMASAITRNQRGEPSTIVGAVIDHLIKEQQQEEK